MFLVDKPRHSNADLILALLKTRPMRLKEIAYELSIDVRVVSTALARLHREGCILTPDRVYSYISGRPKRKNGYKVAK